MQPFRYYLRVRYAECDAQKVVFNGRYGEYVDLAVTEFIRATGLMQSGVFTDFDYQVVKQITEWRAPARFDDVLELSVTAKHLGNTSFTLAVEIRVANLPAVITNVETVYVNVDPQTLAKAPLSERVRQALLQGATDMRIDHAGMASH